MILATAVCCHPQPASRLLPLCAKGLESPIDNPSPEKQNFAFLAPLTATDDRMPDLQNRRDEIAQLYFDALPFEPYPVQEEALFNWFASEQGVLVCAPTGTGRTLIAEAAIFEALHLGKTAYYTTPLIALTDQKYHELCESAEKWGFSANDVGLVTGNRKVNPGAKIQVVVAEILLNRLLHQEAFDFDDVWAVVMEVAKGVIRKIMVVDGSEGREGRAHPSRCPTWKVRGLRFVGRGER